MDSKTGRKCLYFFPATVNLNTPDAVLFEELGLKP